MILQLHNIHGGCHLGKTTKTPPRFFRYFAKFRTKFLILCSPNSHFWKISQNMQKNGLSKCRQSHTYFNRALDASMISPWRFGWHHPSRRSQRTESSPLAIDSPHTLFPPLQMYLALTVFWALTFKRKECPIQPCQGTDTKTDRDTAQNTQVTGSR